MLHWCIRHLLNRHSVCTPCSSRFRLLKPFKCIDIQTLRGTGDKTTPSAQLSINSLAGMNSLLDDFYSSHAQVDTVGRWLASHAFDKALPDPAEAAWMDIQHETQGHIVGNIKDVSYRKCTVRGDCPCNSRRVFGGKGRGRITYISRWIGGGMMQRNRKMTNLCRKEAQRVDTI